MPKDFTLRVDRFEIQIPVAEAVFAHYQEQFKRNTDGQKKRFTTLMKLMTAAYKHGVEDGKRFR